MTSYSSRARQQQLAILERGKRAAVTCDRCIEWGGDQCFFTPTHLERYQKCYHCVKVGQSCQINGVVAKKYWGTFYFQFQPARNTQKGKNKRVLIDDSPEPTMPRRTRVRRAPTESSFEPEPSDNGLDERLSSMSSSPPRIPTSPTDIWAQLERSLGGSSESSESENPGFGVRIDVLEENKDVMRKNIAQLKQEKEKMGKRMEQMEEEVAELEKEKKEMVERMKKMEERCDDMEKKMLVLARTLLKK